MLGAAALEFVFDLAVGVRQKPARSRGVKRSVAKRSYMVKPGKYSRTGWSQSNLSSSASMLCTRVVKALVQEAMAKSVAGVTGNFLPTSR